MMDRERDLSAVPQGGGNRMITPGEQLSAYLQECKVPWSTNTPIEEDTPDDALWKHWRHTGDVTVMINGKRYHAYCQHDLPRAWAQVLAEIVADFGLIAPPESEQVCNRCPRYTGTLSPHGTACPGVETCKKIAANHKTPIVLVSVPKVVRP